MGEVGYVYGRPMTPLNTHARALPRGPELRLHVHPSRMPILHHHAGPAPSTHRLATAVLPVPMAHDVIVQLENLQVMGRVKVRVRIGLRVRVGVRVRGRVMARVRVGYGFDMNEG